MPHRLDYTYDIKYYVYDIKLIIDVGAHIVRSAYIFREYFSNAKTYCIEPVSSTFDELVKNVKKDIYTFCYRVGMGSNN